MSEIHEAVIAVLKEKGPMERSRLAEGLPCARPIALRMIGQMISLGKLKRTASGLIEPNPAYEPGQSRQKKEEGDEQPPRRRRSRPEPEPEAATVKADDTFRPSITDDGALLIFGVLVDNQVLEFTPAQVGRIRALLTAITPITPHAPLTPYTPGLIHPTIPPGIYGPAVGAVAQSVKGAQG